MKVKKAYLLVFSVILCMLLVSSILFMGNAFEKNTYWLNSISADSYDFPISPDVNKDKWIKMESTAEMNAVLQIPEETLKSMSTEGLIATFMKYPKFGDIFLFNSPVKGLEKITNDFNGLRELQSRDDAGDALVQFYSKLDLDKLLATDKYPSLRLQFLEYIIAQPSILSKVSDRKALLKHAYKMAELKQNKYSGKFGITSTLFIMAHVLDMDYPEISEKIKNHDIVSHFLETGNIKESHKGEWDEIWNTIEEKIQSIIEDIE